MRKFFIPLLLLAALSPACANLGAGPSSAGSGVGLSAAEIAKQADGVAAALAALPKSPGDEATAKQIEGYAAWGAFLAKSAAVVVGAVAGS